MLINGKNYSVNELMKLTDFDQNKRQKVNNSLDLTAYQIEVLQRFNIDITSVSTLKELTYYIEEVLDSASYEELELILDEINERDYYENTKK